MLSRIDEAGKRWSSGGGVKFINLDSDGVHQLDMLPSSRHVGQVINYKMPEEIHKSYERSFRSWNPVERVMARADYHLLLKISDFSL